MRSIAGTRLQHGGSDLRTRGGPRCRLGAVALAGLWIFCVTGAHGAAGAPAAPAGGDEARAAIVERAEAMEQPSRVPDARVRLWRALTALETAERLSARGDHAAAHLVLELALERLVPGTSPSSACPAAPSRAGEYLAYARRNLLLAYTLVSRARGSQALRVVQSVERSLEKYARDAAPVHHDTATALGQEIASALAEATESAEPRRGLDPESVEAWWITVERLCHELPDGAAPRAGPGEAGDGLDAPEAASGRAE